MGWISDKDLWNPAKGFPRLEPLMKCSTIYVASQTVFSFTVYICKKICDVFNFVVFVDDKDQRSTNFFMKKAITKFITLCTYK